VGTLKLIVASVTPMFVIIFKGIEREVDDMKDLCSKKWTDVFMIIFCRCFKLLLCSPCLSLGFVLFLCLFLIYPVVVVFFVGLGPAALLLKIRQIPFVMDTYIRSWTYIHFLKFFGFANNVAGLSASQMIRIESFQRALFMTPVSANKEPDSVWTKIGRFVSCEDEDDEVHFDQLVAEALLNYKGPSGMSKLKAWMILNSWCGDPERFSMLLRGKLMKENQETNTETIEPGNHEKQLTAHIAMNGADNEKDEVDDCSSRQELESIIVMNTVESQEDEEDHSSKRKVSD